MDYKNKYLKYKFKYLQLKGGSGYGSGAASGSSNPLIIRAQAQGTQIARNFGSIQNVSIMVFRKSLRTGRFTILFNIEKNLVCRRTGLNKIGPPGGGAEIPYKGIITNPRKQDSRPFDSIKREFEEEVGNRIPRIIDLDGSGNIKSYTVDGHTKIYYGKTSEMIDFNPYNPRFNHETKGIIILDFDYLIIKLIKHFEENVFPIPLSSEIGYIYENGNVVPFNSPRKYILRRCVASSIRVMYNQGLLNDYLSPSLRV